MNRLLGFLTAALVSVTAPAVAFASLIPDLISQGLVSSGADFTYTTVQTVDSNQNADTTTSSNLLDLTGPVIGPITNFVVDDTGFLTGFALSTSSDLNVAANETFPANFGPVSAAAADVPEPGSLALLGTALASLSLAALRRKRFRPVRHMDRGNGRPS